METVFYLSVALANCVGFYLIGNLYKEHTKIMQGVTYLIDQSTASRYITVGGYLIEVERLDVGYRGRLADLEAIKFHSNTLAGLRKEAEKAIHAALDRSLMRDTSALQSPDA